MIVVPTVFWIKFTPPSAENTYGGSMREISNSFLRFSFSSSSIRAFTWSSNRVEYFSIILNMCSTMFVFLEKLDILRDLMILK